MPSTNVEDFEGDSWGACSTFIKSIRAAAFCEGKIRDGAWMADLASIHFSDKALVWYSQLPADIQEDWPKLQAALVDRWSSQCSGNVNDSPATPRGSRSENPSPTASKTSFRGTLKLIMEGSDAVQFVENPINRIMCQPTTDVGRAMNVSSHSVAQSTFLEWNDGPRFSWLCIHWAEVQPNIGYGSNSSGRLTVFNFEQSKSSWTYSGPFQLALCNVSPSGEVMISWKKGETQIPLTPFIITTTIYMVGDPEAFARSNAQAKKAKLVIHRTD